MAFGLRYQLEIDWIPDGASPMTVPSAQKLRLQQTGIVQVPGGDSPTQANFNSAVGVTSGNVIANSMASDLQAQIALALARIQAWSTGGA